MAFSSQALNHGDEEAKLMRRGRDAQEDLVRGTPVRYVPLCEVYSATSPCSKKVKARKLLPHFEGTDRVRCYPKSIPPQSIRPPIVHFYSRCRKRKPSFYNSLVKDPENSNSSKEEDEGKMIKKAKRRTIGSTELIQLGVDSSILNYIDLPRLRENRNQYVNGSNNKVRVRQRRENDASVNVTQKGNSGSARTNRWVWLSFDGVEPKKFIGLQCQVYWPLDDAWYSGRVTGYDSETGRHHVKYVDGDEEKLMLSNERIKFCISPEEMDRLNLSYGAKSSENDGPDADEIVLLAATLDDFHELEIGDMVWAKLTGHAMWPAVVVDESFVVRRKGLNKVSGEQSVVVQFFGSHDFARVKTKQVISFLRGLLSSFHLKCKKPKFLHSLDEAKLYLTEQKLPKRMLRLRYDIEAGDGESSSSSGEDEQSDDSLEGCTVDGGSIQNLEGIESFAFETVDLQVISLGEVVKDSDYFRDERFIWPEGYTAMRKFTSLTGSSVSSLYKMEVLRSADSRPLFRVTVDTGEQFRGSTPSACWKKIYRRIKRLQFSCANGLKAEHASPRIFESGSDMFGFSHPEVERLIKELSKSKFKSKVSKLTTGRHEDLPTGYRPVRVQWKDLDKCSVCHMDEEYENNLFLQCDKCRMMVHARCYGELEPSDGILWLCNLCRPGAPERPPPCCLCPVIGGAMKPTTDGRWAHLACAIWIPETCLSDIKKMEPIDGLSRINKDRWKLLCSICGVSYGACIQCSNHTCYVAYHPLCARAAGFCVELADEDRLHLISMDEDEEDQCIRLFSFCKRHRQPSNERPVNDEGKGKIVCQYSDYTPPLNPSGCARSEPYNFSGRRGRKEPEALTAASLKRLFLENRPYLVGGYSQREAQGITLSYDTLVGSTYSFASQKLNTSQLDASKSILSTADKYKYMKQTFRKRLAFGKSRIHGFGIFAKYPHRAGDMMIEYTGELVRPPIADHREHLIYNSLVGAGTYMFRIDNERVIDATRAGSIAHLINHSCEPNCYSRVISVDGDEHIIIFAKRDIKQWEELTYDYRFFSIDEQLACYCGFPRCCGVVNDIEAEQVAKLSAPRSELIDWRGE